MNRFASIRQGRPLILAFLFLAALGVGAGFILLGPPVVAAVPGLIASLAILTQPILGLIAVLFPVPFEDAVILGEVGTITKLLGAGVAGIWFSGKVLRGDSWRVILSVPLIVLGGLFVIFAGTSIIWADYAQGFSTGILRLVMALALALLVIDIVRSWTHLDWLVRALVVGGVIAALLVLNQYFGIGARRAGDAVAGGINATALMLVTLIPFGFLLIRTSESLIWKLVGISYVSLAILASAVTFSRMTFLLLPLVLGAEIWSAFRGGRGRGAIIVLGIVASILAVRFVPMEEVRDRIATIGPYIESTFGFDEGMSQPYMSERGYHLYVAYRIFQDHPIVGVGYGNYGRQFLQYQMRVPGSRLFYRSPRNPHSSFAGILAELGIIGLALWLAVLASCSYALVLAWRRTRSDPRSRPFLTVHAISVSFVLLLAYGFYAETQNEKIFWLVLAFTVVVFRLTQKGQESDGRTGRDSLTGRLTYDRREVEISSVTS